MAAPHMQSNSHHVPWGMSPGCFKCHKTNQNFASNLIYRLVRSVVRLNGVLRHCRRRRSIMVIYSFEQAMSSIICISSRKLLFYSISVIRRGGRAENGSEAFNVRVSGQRRQTVCSEGLQLKTLLVQRHDVPAGKLRAQDLSSITSGPLIRHANSSRFCSSPERALIVHQTAAMQPAMCIRRPFVAASAGKPIVNTPVLKAPRGIAATGTHDNVHLIICNDSACSDSV